MRIILIFQRKMCPVFQDAFFVFPIVNYFMGLTAIRKKKMHKTGCKLKSYAYERPLKSSSISSAQSSLMAEQHLSSAMASPTTL